MSRQRVSGARKLALRLAAVLVLCAAGACGQRSQALGREVVVQKQDLVLDIEVAGTLKSLESEQVGPPAAVTDTWDFKIIRMVPEGTRVQTGGEVLAFDPSELEKKLADYESEVAGYVEELGKSRAESTLSTLSDRLDLVDAESKQRKAELKAEKPPELTAEILLKVSGIERDLARREVEYRHERQRAKQQESDSELAMLETRLKRARGRVAEIKAAIQAMAVKARRGGTVVYKQNWRGEKKKVGDGTWRGETIIEIASLDRMAAQGQVDEVDASNVSSGQRVGLRLEAHPDREYAGVVERVATLVQTESPESRIKVVLLDIKLAETDPLLMRPGMRFRGRIEIARLPGVVQLPLTAIETTAGGAVVNHISERGSVSIKPVKLGRRSREAVEILEGLQPGERVLLRAADGAGSSPGAGPGAGAGRGGGAFRLGAS